jgi:hypothetical protein
MLISESTKQKIIRWYARQPEAVRIELFAKQRDLFFELRKREQEKPEPDRKPIHEITYESFLNVLYYAFKMEAPGGIKEPDHKIDRIRDKVIERMLRHKKRKQATPKQKKLQQLEKFDKDIRVMREKGLSYQKISEYLNTYHKVKIHFTYIQKYLKDRTP